MKAAVAAVTAHNNKVLSSNRAKGNGGHGSRSRPVATAAGRHLLDPLTVDDAVAAAAGSADSSGSHGGHGCGLLIGAGGTSHPKRSKMIMSRL